MNVPFEYIIPCFASQGHARWTARNTIRRWPLSNRHFLSRRIPFQSSKGEVQHTGERNRNIFILFAFVSSHTALL
jgi:hypothetical protein